MNCIGFDALWSAIPYPALIIDCDMKVIAVNSAAEGFAAMSERQIAGREVAQFLGAEFDRR